MVFSSSTVFFLLEEYELDIVLFNLNEDNTKLREEIYKFFMEVKLEQEFILLKTFRKAHSLHQEVPR